MSLKRVPFLPSLQGLLPTPLFNRLKKKKLVYFPSLYIQRKESAVKEKGHPSFAPISRKKRRGIAENFGFFLRRPVLMREVRLVVGAARKRRGGGTEINPFGLLLFAGVRKREKWKIAVFAALMAQFPCRGERREGEGEHLEYGAENRVHQRGILLRFWKHRVRWNNVPNFFRGGQFYFGEGQSDFTIKCKFPMRLIYLCVRMEQYSLHELSLPFLIFIFFCFPFLFPLAPRPEAPQAGTRSLPLQ